MPDWEISTRRWGRRLLTAAWGLGALILVLPVSQGEFTAPGSQTTVNGWQLMVYIVLLSFSHPPLLWGGLLPLALFVLTPLALAGFFVHHRALPMAWGMLLMLYGVFWIIQADTAVAGSFLLPLPFMLAAAALGVFSYVGVLHAGKRRYLDERRCRGCGHEFRGSLDQVCPECGQTNDIQYLI